MAASFFLNSRPPQFYSQSFELVAIVTIINFVIGGFSGEDSTFQIN